jgi:hypothetical protein
LVSGIATLQLSKATQALPDFWIFERSSNWLDRVEISKRSAARIGSILAPQKLWRERRQS